MPAIKINNNTLKALIGKNTLNNTNKQVIAVEIVIIVEIAFCSIDVGK